MGEVAMRDYQRRAAAERYRTPKNRSKVDLLAPMVIGLIMVALLVAGGFWLMHEVVGPALDTLKNVQEGSR